MPSIQHKASEVSISHYGSQQRVRSHACTHNTAKLLNSAKTHSSRTQITFRPSLSCKLAQTYLLRLRVGPKSSTPNGITPMFFYSKHRVHRIRQSHGQVHRQVFKILSVSFRSGNNYSAGKLSTNIRCDLAMNLSASAA